MLFVIVARDNPDNTRESNYTPLKSHVLNVILSVILNVILNVLLIVLLLVMLNVINQKKSPGIFSDLACLKERRVFCTSSSDQIISPKLFFNDFTRFPHDLSSSSIIRF